MRCNPNWEAFGGRRIVEFPATLLGSFVKSPCSLAKVLVTHRTKCSYDRVLPYCHEIDII